MNIPRGILFLLGILIIVAGVALFLFAPGRAGAPLGGLVDNTGHAVSNGSSNPDSYLTDGVFTIEDVFETSPLPEHTTFLSADQYATYCRDLQTSGRYSHSVQVNAVLAVKAYVAKEELPIYEELLGNIPADADNDTAFAMATANSQAMWDKYMDPGLPRVTVTPDMVENIFMAPFDLHQQIVSLCR